MKVKLQVMKQDSTIYEGTHDIVDAKSFGEAFESVWVSIAERQFGEATSVGALYDSLDDNIHRALDGATIHVEKIDF